MNRLGAPVPGRPVSAAPNRRLHPARLGKNSCSGVMVQETGPCRVIASELNRGTVGFDAQRADVAEWLVVPLGRAASRRDCGEQRWPPADSIQPARVSLLASLADVDRSSPNRWRALEDQADPATG